MSRRLRKRVIIVGTAIIGLLAAWTAAWFYVQGEIRQQTLAWVADQRRQGTTIEYGAIGVSGWPLWWRITIEAPHFVAPSGVQGAGLQGEWRGTRAQAWIRPWDFRDIWLRFEGEHSLTFPNTIASGASGAQDAGPTMTVTLSAAEPDARVLIGTDGQPQEVELDSRDFVVRAPAPIGSYRGARAHVLARLHQTPRSRTDPLLDATISLIDLDLPQPPVPGLATRVQRADLDFVFRGALPPLPPPQAIAAWRDGGGKIDVSRLVLVTAPIDFDGSGDLSLDAQNRVRFSLAGRLRGYTETVDALAGAGTLPPFQALAINFALRGMQRQGLDGRQEIQARAETVDGQLTLNNIPLPVRMVPLRF